MYDKHAILNVVLFLLTSVYIIYYWYNSNNVFQMELKKIFIYFLKSILLFLTYVFLYTGNFIVSHTERLIFSHI